MRDALQDSTSWAPEAACGRESFARQVADDDHRLREGLQFGPQSGVFLAEGPEPGAARLDQLQHLVNGLRVLDARFEVDRVFAFELVSPLGLGPEGANIIVIRIHDHHRVCV